MSREIIERVQRMEEAFDRLQQRFDPALYRQLAQYCSSGQWLRDYEADEAGLLPRDLKRGVLSQDGLYDLLTRLREEAESV